MYMYMCYMLLYMYMYNNLVCDTIIIHVHVHVLTLPWEGYMYMYNITESHTQTHTRVTKSLRHVHVLVLVSTNQVCGNFEPTSAHFDLFSLLLSYSPYTLYTASIYLTYWTMSCMTDCFCTTGVNKDKHISAIVYSELHVHVHVLSCQ